MMMMMMMIVDFKKYIIGATWVSKKMIVVSASCVAVISIAGNPSTGLAERVGQIVAVPEIIL